MTKPCADVSVNAAQTANISWTTADVELDCPPLLFRLIAAHDEALISSLYTNDRIQQFISPALNAPKAHRRFAAMQMANQTLCSDKCYLAIADRQSNEALGLFAVFNLDIVASRCEFGIMLTEKAQGRGIARHALTAILAHLQRQLGVRQIFCVINQHNLAAQRLARQCQLRLEVNDGSNLHYVLDEVITPWRMV